MNPEPSPCRCGNEIIDSVRIGSLIQAQCRSCGIGGPAMSTPYQARLAWDQMQERLAGSVVQPEEQFYLVWNPQGRNPQCRHSYKDKAKDEAKRLAAQNPGQAFYVLHAISVAKAGEATFTELTEIIPF